MQVHAKNGSKLAIEPMKKLRILMKNDRYVNDSVPEIPNQNDLTVKDCFNLQSLKSDSDISLTSKRRNPSFQLESKEKLER